MMLRILLKTLFRCVFRIAICFKKIVFHKKLLKDNNKHIHIFLFITNSKLYEYTKLHEKAGVIF